jgi:hypothetical protein
VGGATEYHACSCDFRVDVITDAVYSRPRVFAFFSARTSALESVIFFLQHFTRIMLEIKIYVQYTEALHFLLTVDL